MLSRLSVKQDQIVNEAGEPVRLRGVGIGGWMNMENFINGYPGTEQGLRVAMSQVLGEPRAAFFFDRLLDYFLSDADLAFIKSCGANVVRLALNYRHFESDDDPFTYLETGFKRLERVVGICERLGLYVILDLHAAQGWQNPDWHSDNSSRQALFWQHPHFQDRFVALWEEFARRFSARSVIAGYNVMNEPVTGARLPRVSRNYQPDWDSLNRVYRRVVHAIRAIDPQTVVFLEGDCFSVLFEGLEAPFAENLVYSSHNYSVPALGPGMYPGTIQGERWDMQKQREVFLSHQGTLFTQRHRFPLWVGEFGCVSNGPADERVSRLAALSDQLSVIEDSGAHWTIWTYKDLGVMGWVELDPSSEYAQLTAAIRKTKEQLGTDFWMHWLPRTPVVKDSVRELAKEVARVVGSDRNDVSTSELFLSQAALDIFVGSLIQPNFAQLFKDMNDAAIDRVLQSFAFGSCRLRQDLIGVLRRYLPA